MRIIGGSRRGRLLKSPRGNNTRPTADRVRESLFNMIGTKIVGARFLDLYAGSGAVGIEALSRGAAKAVFLEKLPANIRLIKENLRVTDLSDKAIVFQGDALEFLRRPPAETDRFDLIFADPPYEKGLSRLTLNRVEAGQLLTEEGWLVIEHAVRENPGEALGSLGCFRRRTYGDTVVSFYQRR